MGELETVLFREHVLDANEMMDADEEAAEDAAAKARNKQQEETRRKPRGRSKR